MKTLKVLIFDMLHPDDSWGSIAYIPGRGLVLEGHTAALQDLIEDCRFDISYGCEYRKLTDEELPLHLFRRPLGYLQALACDEETGEPSDAAADAFEDIWRERDIAYRRSSAFPAAE